MVTSGSHIFTKYPHQHGGKNMSLLNLFFIVFKWVTWTKSWFVTLKYPHFGLKKNHRGIQMFLCAFTLLQIGVIELYHVVRPPHKT